MKKHILLFSLMIGCATFKSVAQISQSAIDNFTVSKGAKELLSANIEKVNEDELYVVQKIKLNNDALPKVTLQNTKTIAVANNKVSDKSKIPTNFEPKVYLSKERKKPIAIVLIPQYVLNVDGSISKLIDYKLDVKEETNTPLNKTLGARVYANNSVLATGNWYKISVVNNGVYKISFDFLNNLGFDATSINPTNIRLYGNGGEMLAEDNAVFRNDDLVENAIQVVDGGDGKMNQGDYVLFYANGPHKIIKDSVKKLFSHDYNLYENESYYFLNFDLGVGKRIQLETTPTTSNQTVTTFNDYQFHEQDSVNVGRNGKLFWGDEFNDLPGRTLSKTFTFSFPDIDVSTPITITNSTGGIQYSSASTMNLNVNGSSFSNYSYRFFGYEFYDPFITSIYESKPFTTNSSTINLNYTFTKGGSEAVGFINYIGINARRNLVFNGYLNFADWNSVGVGNMVNYQIQNANANTQIWDITNPLEPTLMNAVLSGTLLSFNQNADRLHRFVATDGSVVNTPNLIGKVSNQNLHNLSAQDYIIVSHPDLISQANRLAQHHIAKRGYRTTVVTPQEIYNEFSSGSQDISAIRDFAKMLYDKAQTNNDIPKYLLLFGDASYDYKNRVKNNSNLVPTFETLESITKINAYCTDDFFGFLDDNENLNNYTQINTLDIGIGRITAPNISTATDVVTKIINYDSPNSFGPWKNNMTFNADNRDPKQGPWHMPNAEASAQIVNDSLPVYNNYKVYIDALNVESTPSGPRCPDGNTFVREQLYNGTFLMNYNGHGGPHSWCEERIFTQNDINALKNFNKLPLFITATCDFAPFDNPADYSGGEILLSKADGGAIALMTTTQLVFADQNEIMNKNYIIEGFSIEENGKFPTLGDSYRMSKNLRYVSGIGESTAANFRKFALLGDPALPLAFPKYDVFTDSINGISIDVKYDTLKALNKYTITGHLADKQGNFLSGFNGVVYPTIFDKPKKVKTLLQNGNNEQKQFNIQNSTIYKGKATVKNGRFSFTFVVPKDINYEIAKGKISYYANNEIEDANGYDKEIFIGGSSTTAIADNDGPIIKPFMNDEKFADGGIVNSNSTLLVKLSDENGINYTGNSVGHDITAVLDNNTQNTYVLNNFFEADLDDYRSGKVKFPINNLTEGTHTLTIKAWDILNNSSEAKISFEVVSNAKGLIKHVYNYPNPFSTKTNFMFEHNMPNQNLFVNISIMTMTGKVVKTIREQINAEGTRVNNIEWDGLDQYGDKIGNGVYLYKMHVKTATGFSDTKMEKLIILR